MRRLVVAAALVLATNAVAQAPAPDAGVDPRERSRRERVYSRIGSRAITVGDIEDAIAAQTPFQRQRYLDDPTQLAALAHLLVDREVLAAEAERRGLDEAPVPSKERGSNLVQLLMRRTIDAETTPASISDADVTAYYAAHPDEFSRPEMVRASHVLVATEAEATALLERCRSADLATFRQWARDQSLDTETKQSGGDLRYFTRDGRPLASSGRPVAGPIVAAAFPIAEVGECAAAPVALENRFSVVMLTGRRPAETTSVQSADALIRRKIWRTRREAALASLTTTLSGRTTVTRRDELLMQVTLPPPSPADLGRPPHAH